MHIIKNFRAWTPILLVIILLFPIGAVKAGITRSYFGDINLNNCIGKENIPNNFVDEMARAILADDNCLVDAMFTCTNVTQGIVLSLLGIIHPTCGDTFTLISTGVAGAVPVTTNASDPGSERGTDFGGTYDFAELTLILQVPDRHHYLYYDIQYFTTDYPEYTAGYIDKLTATVDSPSQGTTSYAIDVSSGDFVLTSNEITGTGFDIFAIDGNPTDRNDEVTTTPIQGSEDAGATALITRAHPVSPNEQIAITFRIEDVSDNLLDSAMFIDNLMFSGFY